MKSPPIETKLSKKERGRLKKLKGRATVSMSITNSSPGISNFDDASELRTLLKKTQSDISFGPSIHLVQSSNSDSNDGSHHDPTTWKHTEGCDHRDLIHSILFQNDGDGDRGDGDSDGDGDGDGAAHGKGKTHGTKQTRKRKRNERFPPGVIPSWSRLHNPAMAETIAIVECSISNQNQKPSAETPMAIMPSQRMVLEWKKKKKNGSRSGNGNTKPPGNHPPSTTNESIISRLLSQQGHDGRKALPLKCRLFQGDRPRHVTDMFMYLDKKNTFARNKVQKQSSLQTNGTDGGGDQDERKHEHEHEHEHVLQKLEELVLPSHIMKRGGYPMYTKHKNEEEIKQEPTVLESLWRSARERHENLDAPFAFPFDPKTSRDIVQSLKVDVHVPEDHHPIIQHNCPNTCTTHGTHSPNQSFVQTYLDRNQLESTSTRWDASSSSSSSSKIYSIDCEMVRTSERFELARVTLLQFCPSHDEPELYKVVLDELVKPKHPILDYLTKYSGITAQILENVTTTLEEVQVALLVTVCKDDIVIGQSLENDMKALCLVHSKVVDTAELFRSESGRKFSLKHLAASLLKIKIQDDATVGHCSEEDAAAALVLAIRRARIGEEFKIHERGGRKNVLSLMTQLRRGPEDEQPPFLRLNRGPMVCIGPHPWIHDHIGSQSAANALECDHIMSSSTKAISSYLRPGGRRASILWSKLNIDVNGTDEAAAANRKIDEIIVSTNIYFSEWSHRNS